MPTDGIFLISDLCTTYVQEGDFEGGKITIKTPPKFKGKEQYKGDITAEGYFDGQKINYAVKRFILFFVLAEL